MLAGPQHHQRHHSLTKMPIEAYVRDPHFEAQKVTALTNA
jgi:hypothetical protein